MATLDPMLPYVRFYLSVLDELDRAAASLASAHADVKGTLAPHEASLRELPDAPALAPAATLGTQGLWRPRDPAQLTGLTDVYEVVGRFTFQGEDDANLQRVRALVDALRAEVERQRASLADLARVPTLASERAAALEEKELASSRAQQAELLKQFEPAAAELREIAQKLLGAVRAEKRPDLARLDQAEAAYQDYVSRVRALYAKALPYLRGQLAELCRLAGCEVPASWPDTLPFAPTLPPELVTPPAPDSPALLQARQLAEQNAAQEAALQRAHDELGVQLRRSDGELAALAQREAEALKEIATAKVVVRWATKLDELDGVRAQLAAGQSEAQSRLHAATQYRAESQRAQATVASMQKDATEQAQALAAREQAQAEHKKDEPALFGKDEWRRKGEELDAEVAELRAELTRRQQALQAALGEVSRLEGRAQSEQASAAAVGRQLEELRAREAAVAADVARAEQELGAARPARRVTVAQAEEVLAQIQGARNEARARVERIGAEMRRIREDIDRATVQTRQLAAERERLAAALRAAHQQSTSAHDEALRTLAARRQAGFDSHAQQVLSGLEDSLSQVDRLFVDPARRVLLVRAGVMSSAPGEVRERGAAFGRALAEAAARAETVHAATREALARVERDFLEKSATALPAAWQHA